jgi:hypothetical protein
MWMPIMRHDRAAPLAEGEGTQTLPGGDESVEANARLTGSTAAVLFVLLLAEGFTILRIRPLLSAHVFIGMLLVPPVVLKIGSTSFRFVRYYLGAPSYRRNALLLVQRSLRPPLLLLHRASFVLWFGGMAIHVLGHVVDTTRLAPRDWMRRTRRDVAGAGPRQWALVSSVVVGALLGVLFLGQVRPWLKTSDSHVGSPLHPLSHTASPTTKGSPLSSTPSSAPPRSTTTPLGATTPVSKPTVAAVNTSVPSPTISAHPVKSHKHHGGRKSKH